MRVDSENLDHRARYTVREPDSDVAIGTARAADTEEGWIETYVLQDPPATLPAMPGPKARRKVAVENGALQTVRVWRDWDLYDRLTGKVVARVRRQPGNLRSTP